MTTFNQICFVSCHCCHQYIVKKRPPSCAGASWASSTNLGSKRAMIKSGRSLDKSHGTPYITPTTPVFFLFLFYLYLLKWNIRDWNIWNPMETTPALSTQTAKGVVLATPHPVTLDNWNSVNLWIDLFLFFSGTSGIYHEYFRGSLIFLM